MRGLRTALGAITVMLLASTAELHAAAEVVYQENFDGYAAQANPSGWVDTVVGYLSTRRRLVGSGGSLYKTSADPLDAANVVFGAKNASGDPQGSEGRFGVFSTLTAPAFARSLDFTGRFLRGSSDTRIGVTFFSSYPDKDRYGLIGLAPASDGHLTMQLFSYGAGSFSGATDSGFTPDPNVWYRFRVVVDADGIETSVRARFWRYGEAEPSIDSIAATQRDAERLTGGRIGIWSAISGPAYVDDLAVSSASAPIAGQPSISISSPSANQMIGSPRVVVSGTIANVTAVTVNGVGASVDPARGTFTSPEIPLLEGENAIVAIASDAGGQTASASIQVIVDTRAPELTVSAPLSGACIDATTIDVRGTATDSALKSVKVTAGASSIDAVIAADSSWSASVPAPAEAEYALKVEASDTLGHTSTAILAVTVDRTPPRIDVSESGAALDGVITNRSLAPIVTTNDALATTTTTLDGALYSAGVVITAEGNHQIKVTATDCAGHVAQKTVSFTIDRTPPQILTVTPSSGSTIAAKSALTGTASPDAANITIEPAAIGAAMTSGTFTVTDVPLSEGANDLTIVLMDHAGNTSRTAYQLTLHSLAPSIEIVENGSPIAPGALFNRAVSPIIRSSAPDAKITATLNAAAYTLGTTITADGGYTLAAIATDAAAHAVQATVTFTIDTTPPTVKVTSPLDGASVTATTVDVRGTVSSDALFVSVNGVGAVIDAGTFVATIPLDAGPNDIAAIARDPAGNIAADRLVLTRVGGPRGILLTSPPDGMVTNRNTIAVTGQLLTGSEGAKVTIGGSDVPVDALGSFRKNDFALSEGDNVIVAAVQAEGGETNQVSVHVLADRMPPRLRVLASGQPVPDAARFGDRAVITVEATDGNESLTPQLTVDGTSTALPATITAPGGHTIGASARDRAGNETRMERTIFIGANGAEGCALGSFDPPSGSVVTANSITVAGRSGGAAGVKINGNAAFVANGSFCGTVELPAEGENGVTIVCTDAGGNPTGTPATIILRRVTGEPSLTISNPSEGASIGSDAITVTGTAGAGVTAIDVNGVAATISGDSFSAAGVRLAGGLNVIVARGHNAAGRIAAVSRRVVYLKDAPSLTITSPGVALTTGTPSIDVTGGWSNLDPATIAIAGAAVQTTSFDDRSGTFSARSVALTAGQQTITVSGRDTLSRTATATVDVTVTPGAPSISITDPADNSIAGASTGSTFTVSGTFAAAPGSTVDVGGVPAAVTGSSFTATVPFSTMPNGITPVVARVTEPVGAVAIDAIRVQKLTVAPRVIDGFPPANAVEVDAGALPLVLFSAPMDRTSLASAFRLETSGGSPVTGTLRVDGDVLTFAPAALLASGGTYTLRVTTAAHDIAGNPLGAEFTSSFTVASSAPGTPPAVTPIEAAICAQQKEIRGVAPAGSRVRLDYGALSLNTNASSTGAFTFQLPLSGQSGCQIARVRVAGADGSLSPSTEVRFQVDCNGPQVTGAAFDRAANRLAITFSKPMNASTLVVGQGGSILLQLGSRFVSGTVSISGNVATISPADDLSQQSFTLSVTTDAQDTSGAKLAFAYTQDFTFDADQPPSSNHGLGFMSGEVFDGDTGRPLGGASVSIEVPTAETISATTDARGRYAAQLPEGAHTIRISAPGFVTVWRQIIVVAGSGVIPIDVRLAKKGSLATAGSGDLVITHAALAPAELRIPAGGVAAGTSVSLTSLAAQSLPGLLPLGWSPLAAATIDSGASPISAAQLTFTVAAADITAAAQIISAVRYRDDRDEWQVLVPVVNIGSDGKAALPIDAPGTYALVYADRAAGLVRPPAVISGGTLQGVIDPCAGGTCPPLTAKSFTIDPPVVLPTGRSIVTLKINGLPPAVFPSGTAVQAYIDEELQLADGSRVSDPPFTTDLLLYRTLSGDPAVAQLQLAPSAKAAELVLNVGFDHIRIVPYPGRLDRGTIIGPEGGRVPGDSGVSIDLPSGAAPEALRATSAAITDFGPFGSIAGFSIVGGFTLTLQRASAQSSATLPRVELLMPAHAVFAGIALAAQHVIVEVLDDTPYGRIDRLAAQTIADSAGRLTTRSIDRNILPIDGIVHEGRYLLLQATAPIAFATGTVRVPGAAFVGDARVIAPPLGVADVTRPGGIFCIPVPARPAAPFTLIPRTPSTGDGAVYTHSASPDPDSVVRADLTLILQPPVLTGTIPAADAADISLTTSVKATFSPAIDPQSVSGESIAVHDESGAPVTGLVAAEGTSAVVWTLPPGERLLPNRRYTVSIAPAIRGTNGAPFARTYSFSFSTQKQLVSGDVHREKIRITVPDSSGHSRIVGDPGALPAGWQAVAIRRGRDFTDRPQATAANDGSFVIDLPGTIALTDMIDLQVVNSAGSVAAIFALTPFVSEDGKSFIAPPDQDVRFTTADGKASVSVPAGAFDEPTTVTVTPADHSAFAAVPAFDKELGFAGAVNVDFPGVAKKRLEIEIAAPPNASPQTAYYLGRLGNSVLGPRVEIVDTLRLQNGKLTTTFGGGAANAAITRALRPGTNQTFSDPQDAKNAMIAAIRGGTYEASSFQQPIGWLLIETAITASGFDMFSSSNGSIYLSALSLTEKEGRTLFPVASGTPFQLVGYDSSTGLEMFRIDHQAADALDPLNAIPTAIVNPGDMGPYPIFAAPSRLEVATVPPDGVTLRSVRGLNITQRAGTVTVSDGLPPLPANTRVDILDVTSAVSISIPALPGSATFAAATGDRLLIAISDDTIDPDQTIALVFSSAIDLGGATGDQVDAVLQGNRWIQIDSGDTAATVTEVTKQAVFTADNAARRIFVHLPLQRGKVYHVVIKGDLSGPALAGAPGLKLGQRNVGGNLVPANPNDITLEFRTRKPGGPVGSMTLPPDRGGIRDFALIGNVALIATTAGGLQAFDVSDPASLSRTPAPAPLGRATGTAEYWSVSADRHGRIFAAGVTSTYGVVQTYRIEDFVDPAGGIPSSTIAPTSGANVSWRLGINIGVPLGTDLLFTDRPEAIPRKVQVLLQDDEKPFPIPPGGTPVGTNGFVRFDASVVVPGTLKYWKQRITIENRTIGAHWSADIKRGTTGVIRGVLARPDDELFIVRNNATYGVVSLFGYGVGVFDLNAVESNDEAFNQSGYDEISERVILTPAKGDPNPNMVYPTVIPCDSSLIAPTGAPCEIRDLTFSPDALIFPSTTNSNIEIYALDQLRGMLDIDIAPPKVVAPGPPPVVSSPEATPAFGLSLSDPFVGARGSGNLYHPRLRNLHNLFLANGGSSGIAPRARFTSVSPYLRTDKSGNPENFALIAANNFGLLVVKIDPAVPLTWGSLVDVIWVPAGALSVRVIPRTDLAVVIDNAGRVLLVDLRNIDESALVAAMPPCSSATCEADLFPTAKKSIISPTSSLPPYADWIEVGVDDPRIVWKSDPHTVSGNIPPVIDPDTGILLTGDINGNDVKAIAAIDPRIQFRIRTDSGTRYVNSIVPLGIAPKDPTADPDSSYGAFRLEITLPGSIVEQLTTAGRELRFAVESERVVGATTEQTLTPMPPAHIRLETRSRAADPRASEFAGFRMERLAPYDPADPQLKLLRYQRAYNRFISPWIVAIADPRASEQFTWTNTTRSKEGCVACERPLSLRGRTAPAVYELFTRGRVIAVRPENDTFNVAGYRYLGDRNRFEARAATWMADTVRAPSAAAPAQNPPVAGGMLQERTYLHSGELEVDAGDLDAGGRAGFNVVFGRSYHSRVIGLTPLGLGWLASMFDRVRELPTGGVEYRDSSGEVWLFQPMPRSANDYVQPAGVALTLHKTRNGWSLMDAKRRFVFFDALGRLMARTDHFADAQQIDNNTLQGNVIRYLYGSSGQLEQIVDPVGRTTTLTYWDAASAGATGAAPDQLREISDWRNGASASDSRKVTFEYDSKGRLMDVRLPEAAKAALAPPEFDHTGANRPRIHYTYAPLPSASYNDYIDFAGNLDSITDPVENTPAGSRRPRVQFAYDQSTDAFQRDRVIGQTWPCASYVGSCVPRSASFRYQAPPPVSPVRFSVDTTDVLDQIRHYDLLEQADKRMHIAKATVFDVPIVDPGAASTAGNLATDVPSTPTPLTSEYTYDANGQITSATMPDGATLTNRYEPAASTPLGRIGSTVYGSGSLHLRTGYRYETYVTEDAIVSEVGKDYSADVNALPVSFRESQSPNRHRDTIEHKDAHPNVATTSGAHFNVFSQLDWTDLVAFGRSVKGLIPQLPNFADAKEVIQQAFENSPSAPRLRRGRVTKVSAGNGALNTTVDYQTGNTQGQVIQTFDQERWTLTIEEHDSADRVTRRVIKDRAGAVMDDETFGYDANGRLVYSSVVHGGTGTVETRHTFDTMGREVETTIKRAKVADADADVVVRREYDLGRRVNTTYDPVTTGSAAKSEEILDGLGRVIERRRTGTSSSIMKSLVGYDLAGKLCYESDAHRVATLHVFDVLGRETKTMTADGIVTERTFSPWGELIDKQVHAGSTLIAHSISDYSDEGELVQMHEEVGSGLVRGTGYADRDGGEISRVGVAEVASMSDPMITTTSIIRARVTDTSTDTAGRGKQTRSGEVAFNTPLLDSEVFSQQSVAPSGFDGSLPKVSVTEEPRVGSSYTTTTTYDGLGRVVEVLAPGGYLDLTSYEPNNVVIQKPAGQGETKLTYDPRGLLIERERPRSAIVHSKYDARGNITERRDETGGITKYDYDDLGRLIRTTYPDSTTEEVQYEAETGVRTASRDRAGQWLMYSYDDRGGRLTQVHLGGTGSAPSAGAVLIQYAYDAAGRLLSVRDANGAVEYDGYDMLGRPAVTRAIRYRNASGLTPSPDVLDVHAQGHVWTVFNGERKRWSMPVAGSTPPPSTSPSPWHTWIEETRDGGGDVVSQRSILASSGPAAGPLISESFARSGGRPMLRKRYTSSGAVVSSAFGYADLRSFTMPPEVPDPISPAPGTSGMLGRVEVTVGNDTLAGSEIARNGSKRIETEIELGLDGRRSVFHYDDLQHYDGGRMHSSEATPAAAGERVTLADFRAARTMTPPVLDPADVANLRAAAKDVLPADWTATENDSHQIGQRDLTFGPINDTTSYAFSGGRRTQHGQWTASYDERGRLVRLELAGDRRIDYVYDPNDRVIGRSAYQASGGAWSLETRASVLAHDGLPADSTFVWDVITDRLLAIYEAGGGLLRQYIHGDHGVDDFVQIRTPETYIPVFDDAGTGLLQAVLGDDGNLVERVLYADPYGDSPRYLQGAVIDNVSIAMEKNGAGDLDTMTIRAHATDQIDPSTLATAGRIASVTADFSVAQQATVTPTLVNDSTIEWVLHNADWQALANATGATALEIGIGSGLRFPVWGATPVSAPPGWTSIWDAATRAPGYPFVVRRSLGNLLAKIAALPPGRKDEVVPFKLNSLYLAGALESKLHLFTGFKSAPFVEPANGLVYVRARWYDGGTGGFLTPDKMGYKDSSNSYAFCAGDPVNCEDPSGLVGIFFDGTWDDEKTTAAHVPSNVYRLSNAYTGGQSAYFRGIGNSTENGAIKQGLGGAFGLGGADIVDRAFGRVKKAYAHGDRVVDIVGFSRGASLALELAARIEKSPELRGMKLRFIGLFDAVGSFGDPGNPVNLGYDLRTPTSATLRVHLIARDEARQNFELIKPAGFVEHTLPGGHTNVGGTWPNREFGNRALWTMIEEANSRLEEPIFDPALTDFGGGDTTLPKNVTDTYEQCRWPTAGSEMCQQRHRGVFEKGLRWGTAVAEPPRLRRPQAAYPFE